MTWTKENMFEPSGCFTREAFEALVNNTLPADAKALANEHLQLCPFCSDALEGFQSLKEKHSLAEIMAPSDEAFSEVLAKKHIKPERKRTIWLSISAAASVLLLVGLFMLMNSPKPKMQVAENITKDTIVITKPAEETPKNKEKIIEKEKQPISETRTNAIKPDQKTVRFTPPVITNEDAASEVIVEDKLKEEPKTIGLASQAAKSIENAGATADIKLESPEGQSANKSLDKNEYKSYSKSLKAKKVSDKEETAPLLFVEQMPEYPGGQKAMMDFINQNLQYPKTANEMGISGRVIVSFMVEESGNISDIKILRGIGGGCDEEAIRVVKLMPNWKSGKQNGKAVKTYFTLPIIFALQNK